MTPEPSRKKTVEEEWGPAQTSTGEQDRQAANNKKKGRGRHAAAEKSRHDPLGPSWKGSVTSCAAPKIKKRSSGKTLVRRIWPFENGTGAPEQ